MASGKAMGSRENSSDPSDALGTGATMAPEAAGSVGTEATMAPEAAGSVGTEATMAAGSADALATGATMTADSAAPARSQRASVSAGAAAQQASAGELPTVDASCYAVLSEYGRGGLGRILRARDRRTGRIVAIKEMLPDASHAAARFRREALITANLQHPAIVPVYEVGRWLQDGRPFYAMKLVTGRDLQAVIKDTDGPRARLALLPHVTAVAEALAYSHSERIIHRDLKPANVLVGDFGETVVIDWGLAKDLADPAGDELPATPFRTANAGLTQAGAIVGTPAYMPPEQARGAAVDERADVYAIGAMLYHLLVGRAPYADSKTLEELLSKVLAGPPARAELEAADAPPDLLAIVDKAMAHDRADRYPTARELAEDLRRFQTGKLVAAHAYSMWQLARRWIARHRAAVAVAAVAAVAVAGLAVVGVQRIRVERDTARAESVRADAARADATRQLASLYAEQGRRALGERDANRAAALLAEAYALGNDSPATRMSLAQALDGVAARADAVVLPGADRGWFDLAFAPDGSTLTTIGGLDYAAIWDASTGRELARWPTPGGAIGVAYSPDGARVALLDAGRRAHMIDVATRRELWTSEPLGEQVARVPVFSPDGRAVAFAANDRGLALVFDAIEGGAPRLELREPGVTTVAFDDVGAHVLTASPGVGLGVWDARTGKRLRVLGDERDSAVSLRTLRGGRALVLGMHGIALWNVVSGQRVRTFAVDRETLMGMAVDGPERYLFAWGASGTVYMWSIDDGMALGELDGHSNRIGAAAYGGAGGRLATVGYDGTLRVWDPMAHAEVFALGGLGENVQALAIQPGATRVAFADRDFAVRIVDYGAHARFMGVDATALKAESLAFSLDGKRAIIGTLLPALPVIDTATGRVVRELEVPPPGPVYAVYSADGSRIAAANGGDVVAIYDADGEQPVATLRGAGSMMAIAPDGGEVIVGRADGELRAFDAQSGAQRWAKKLFDASVSAVEYAPDGKTVLVGCDDGKGALVTVATGDATPVPSHRTRLRGARFAPDGSFVVTVSLNEPLHVVDTATGALRRAIGDNALSLALSPDGARLASGHFQGDVGVWDVATGERLAWFPTGSLPVVVLRYAADGERVLTTQLDGEVAVWSAADGTRLVTLEGHSGSVLRAALSPDGARALVVGDRDVQARLWNVALESRPPDEVRRVAGCDSGWLVEDGRLVPGRAAGCP